MRLVMSAVLSAMLGLFFSQGASAQSRENPSGSPCQDQELVKAGTVEGEISVVGFLVGVGWGSGTLFPMMADPSIFGGRGFVADAPLLERPGW